MVAVHCIEKKTMKQTYTQQLWVPNEMNVAIKISNDEFHCPG